MKLSLSCRLRQRSVRENLFCAVYVDLVLMSKLGTSNIQISPLYWYLVMVLGHITISPYSAATGDQGATLDAATLETSTSASGPPPAR